MADPNDTNSREAKFGEKMIEIKVRFWTDGLSGNENEILPKQAWSAGLVRIKGNKAHGIAPNKPVMFHSLMDIQKAIEETIIKNGIILHPSRVMKKYIKKCQ